MKSLWWGACVVGCVAALSGCSHTGKWITAAEVLEYNSLKSLNQENERKIATLEGDKELLTYKVQAQEQMIRDKGALLEALQANMRQLPPDVSKDVDIKPTWRGVQATIGGDLLFKSGAATLTSNGEKVLDEIVKSWRDKPNKIAVCGFTDSAPIKHTAGKWADNFDLSGHRALEVLHYLEKHGIAPERMHFEGYGQYDLIREGGKENMARSRRAEIILLNENVNPGEVSGAMEKPAPKPTRTPKPKPPMTPK